MSQDGVLDASDAESANFKVMVTEAKTLAQLNITSINLTADATHIELLDGSIHNNADALVVV